MPAETAEGRGEEEEAEREEAGQADHRHLGLQAGAAAQARHSQTAQLEAPEWGGGGTARPHHLGLQQPGQVAAAVQGDVGQVQVGQPLPGNALRPD